jgi:predicted metal-dependent HD superfamily phosphohydrolase
MRDAQLEKTAELHYDPSLPYHNFGHIRDALTAAETILTRCRARRRKLDETAVYYAVLFHDAGYQEDHRAKGFEHKEDYSAKIAEEALTKALVPVATVRLACEAIRATRKGYEGKPSPEAQVVRAADLAQLAAPYPVFKSNTIKLWKEQERMRGDSMPWQEWKAKAVPEVEYFLESLYFVEPGGSQADAEPFLRQVRANLTALAQDNTVS